MTELAEGQWVNANDVAKTYFCRTPDCRNEATRAGRGVYCRECRERRARMRTSLVEDEVEPAGAAAFEAIRRGGGMSTAVDDASYYPGNNPVPEQEKAAVEAPARNGKPAEPTGHVGQFAEIGNAAAISSPTTGPMERAALELVQAGKALDDALRASVEAKQKVAVAARAWREAISELPSATNGHAPDVETTT